MERASFDKPLDVLERNKLIETGSLAMLAAGPLMLAACIAGVFPPGLIGVHVTLFGLYLWLATRRTNMRAKRRRARVRADHAGVWADGKLVVARAEIADGFFQPRAGRDHSNASSYGSSVRLVGKRGRLLFEAEADESESLALLYSLGLDPSSKRAEFNGSSPLYATLARNLLFIFGVMGATILSTSLLTAVGMHGPFSAVVLVPLIFAGMLPSKIAIGVDGVLVRWLWQKKFIPMSRIASIQGVDDRTIRISFFDGGEELLYTSMRRRGSFGAQWAMQHRDAVLARLREALAAFRARGPAADVSALVGKGTRTRREWLEALAKLREAEGGYRDAVVREEDLWRVVEDPAAPEDARGGAAMLLRRSLDDAGKARVRVAADATASPKLRVALDAAAGDAEDAAVRGALEELAGDDDDVDRRAAVT